MVEEAVKWFNENPLVLNQRSRIDVIKNALRRACVDETLVEGKAALVNRTLNLLTPSLNSNDAEKWKSTLYTYKQKTCCCLIFKYEEETAYYIVDDCGNFYLSESDFIGCAMKFSNCKDFMSHDGFEQLKINEPYDDDLIVNNVSNCFKRLKNIQKSQESRDHIAFANFVVYCNNPFIVVNVLKKLKAFFHFFDELDKFETKHNDLLPLSFRLIDQRLQIYFPNFERYEIETERRLICTILCHRLNIDHLKTKLKDSNVRDVKQQIPYGICMDFLNIVDRRDQDRYTDQLHERECFDPQYNSSPEYRNHCYLIAVKIAEYLSRIWSINLTSLKFIAYWTDVYAEYSNISEQEIIKHYQENERYINDYFAKLVKLAKHYELRDHHFTTPITAAYHIEEHYDDIEAAVGSFLSFPEYDETNLDVCVSCYLQKLPPNLFYGDFKRSFKSSDDDGIKRQDFIFEKGYLKGIKYKFLPAIECSNLSGNLDDTPGCLDGTLISTMLSK